MRSLIISLVAASVCLCVSAGTSQYDIKNGRHNLSMGTRRYYPSWQADMLIEHDNPRLDSSFMRVQSHDVCYPSGANNLHGRISITAFNVTDLMPKGEGGYAFITKGGINSGILCLHLKTQRGYGYNFNIDIWGYRI